MAGQPIYRLVRSAIDARALRAGRTPLDYLCLWIESSQSLAALARDIADNEGVKLALKQVTVRPLISRYAHFLDPDGTALVLSRERGAYAMVERAGELLDDTELDPENPAISAVRLNKAKAQSEYLVWLAARLNQSTFGERKAVTAVQINIGDTILAAMRAPLTVATVAPVPLLTPAPPDPDFIVDDLVARHSAQDQRPEESD